MKTPFLLPAIVLCFFLATGGVYLATNRRNEGGFMEELQGEEEGQGCRPRVFGYNSSQAERMYPSNVTFAPCCLAPFYILTLDKSKRRVNITCQEEETPYIAVGLKRKEEKLGGEKVFLDWKIRPDGEEMGDREYVFGRCGKTWTEGLLVNWFNASAAARADSTVRTLRERQGLPGNYRPLAVYMVMLDSVSRLHFNRSFPHTMRYLRNASQYEEVGEMYDFEVNNAAGGNTAPNMIPLLFGHSLSTHQSRLHNLTLADLQESSLWKTYERAGFVTLLGYDSVWDYLSKYIGKDVATDHVVANFYKAAKKIFGYEDNLTKPRCFGCSNAHNYLLNYLSDYHSNYHGFNRFAYLHLSPGHEKTGLVIRTADQDLLNFLEKMVQNAAKNPNEDMVLMSEEYEAMVENLLPAQWMFVTKSLLERVGRDTGERVKGNSGRLVSRYDWHVTLLHLSTLPYMQLTAASALYQSWQNQSPALHPISLFLEAIPSTRTCSDVAIPLYLCMCFDYHLADRSHEHTGASIASRAVDYINTRVRDAGELCEVVEGKGVVRVLVRELGQEAYYYKVRFAVVGSVALFEAIALVAPNNVFELYAEESSDTHFLTPNTLIQLNEVTRVDEYSGVCEELGKSASIPPSFCLCKLPYPSPLPASIRPPVLSVLSRLTLLHAPTGIPCDLGCSYAGFTCAVWAFPLLNHTDILSLTPQIYRLKDQTYHSFASLNAEMSPTLTPGLQLTSDSQGKWLVSLSHSLLTCELKSLTGQLLCPCY